MPNFFSDKSNLIYFFIIIGVFSFSGASSHVDLSKINAADLNQLDFLEDSSDLINGKFVASNISLHDEKDVPSVDQIAVSRSMASRALGEHRSHFYNQIYHTPKFLSHLLNYLENSDHKIPSDLKDDINSHYERQNVGLRTKKVLNFLYSLFDITLEKQVSIGDDELIFSLIPYVSEAIFLQFDVIGYSLGNTRVLQESIYADILIEDYSDNYGEDKLNIYKSDYVRVDVFPDLWVQSRNHFFSTNYFGREVAEGKVLVENITRSNIPFSLTLNKNLINNLHNWTDKLFTFGLNRNHFVEMNSNKEIYNKFSPVSLALDQDDDYHYFSKYLSPDSDQYNRILCGTLSHTKSHHEAVTLHKTWGHLCDKHYIFSNGVNNSAVSSQMVHSDGNNVISTPFYGEDYWNLFQKTRMIFQLIEPLARGHSLGVSIEGTENLTLSSLYLNKRLFDILGEETFSGLDFILFTGDDSCPVMPRLREYMSTINNLYSVYGYESLSFAHSIPIYYGFLLRDFIAGSFIMFNIATYKIYMQHFYHTCYHTLKNTDDAFVGACFSSMNVMPKNGNTLDGEDLFYSLTVEYSSTLANNIWMLDWMVNYKRRFIPRGRNSMSGYFINQHYCKGKEMINFYKLVY